MTWYKILFLINTVPKGFVCKKIKSNFNKKDNLLRGAFTRQALYAGVRYFGTATCVV
ncbi:hypothetical protein Pf1_00340 [Flavobacterium columnare]|nr:hypothetical protein Pf1_00340 [Flavobacterium columnare]